jgi:hypothetical protein
MVKKRPDTEDRYPKPPDEDMRVTSKPKSPKSGTFVAAKKAPAKKKAAAPLKPKPTKPHGINTTSQKGKK